MSVEVDWRELVTRAEDPEHLAGTQVEVTSDRDEDFWIFVRSFA